MLPSNSKFGVIEK